MPDIFIRHIDRLMADRIKSLAKERQWSINDVVLHALRHGLGVAESSGILAETMLDSENSSSLTGHWEASERAAFQEAMHALASVRSERLASGQRHEELLE